MRVTSYILEKQSTSFVKDANDGSLTVTETALASEEKMPTV